MISEVFATLMAVGSVTLEPTLRAVPLNVLLQLTVGLPDESVAETEFGAIQMRALRRKARRISAYARWSASALNSLAAQVETDIAGLQH